MIYDVIIVGAGPAGLTAAIYTCRKKLKTLIVTQDIGGQTSLAPHIENYPGFDVISGPELIEKMRKQVIKFGTELIIGEVTKIQKKGKNFMVFSGEKNFQTETIILASGKTAKRLNIPGEDKFFGKGISTCATCDAPLFKNKIVAVIGGGNSAFEAAELVSKFSKKVYLIHRRGEFKADEITIQRVKKNKKIEMIVNVIAKKVNGNKFVESLEIENLKTKEKKELKVHGIFVEIGYELKTEWLKDLVNKNKINEIIIDERCRTSLPGFFAAGDVSSTIYKQAIISAGEGSKAGLEAYKHIKGIEKVVDWK